MRIDVLTIFPELIESFCSFGLLGRAQRKGLVQVQAHDLRDGATDVHRSVDDTAFGGGPGMVLAPGPISRSVERTQPMRPLLLLSPGGKRFDQKFATELSHSVGFSLLCGRYEGVDQRAIDKLCDDEVSIGDFVLAGGEVGALTIIEATTRLVPGVMGNENSATSESFGATGLLEYPQYTRPADFEGDVVPEVLQSGNHALIERWRLAAALAKTIKVRPDLILARGGISDTEREILCEFGHEKLLVDLD